MANDKELNIHLKTTADAAGVTAVEAALKGVAATSEEASRAASAAAQQEVQWKKENAELWDKWTSEWKEQSKQVRDAAVDAMKDVEAEATRAADAAESAAATGVQNVGLQKAAQMKEIASQAREIGASLKQALDTMGDGQADVIQKFDAVAQAGTSAISGIAAGFLAFGPAGAATVAVLSGLRLMAETMEEGRKSFEKMTKDMLKDAEAYRKKIDDLLGRGSSDYSGTRTQAVDDRDAAEARADRKRGRRIKDAETGSTVADLEDDAPDSPEKVARKMMRDEELRKEKAAADAEAIKEKQAAEQALQDKLGGEEQELMKRIRSREDKLTAPGERNPKTIAQMQQELPALRKELAEVREELRRTEGRDGELIDNINDNADDYAGASAVGKARGMRDYRSAQVRDANREQTVAARRKQRAEADLKKQRPSNGQFESDDVSDVASSSRAFAKSKRGAGDRLGGGDPRLNNLERAAKALEDGATAEELKALDAAIEALSGTILTSRSTDAALIKGIAAKVETLAREIEAGKTRGKNERP